ncbi:MAG: hypothetical protein HQ446_00715 [Polaromonas sp.]|nr:hypothetical protein [Polaromonas sp.]
MDALQKRLNELSVLDALARLPEMATLETSEAAIFLRVSLSTLERWRRDGNGPLYIQVGKEGARSFNQKCRYQKADLINFQDKHKFSSSTKAATMRGLGFIRFSDPFYDGSEFDLTTKRPFYVNSRGFIVSSVQDTILQDVIERLGKFDIKWIYPVPATYMTWSATVAHTNYCMGLQRELLLTMNRIDSSLSRQQADSVSKGL